ncbi:hypothetical protein HaLaN_07414, partial [Haematococcus lacustris]
MYGAQDRVLEQFFKKLEEDMAKVSMERHGHAKQLVVFLGAVSIGTGGGWGADAVLRACCKVVCRPRGSEQLRGRVVLVDEHRTTRVSSAVYGKQPCEEELGHKQPTRPAGWKPPAGQVEWPHASPHRSHAAARRPRSQQPQSQGPALPRQPSAASAPRLSRQLSPPSAPRAKARARLPKLSQHHSLAGGWTGLECSSKHAAHWGEQVAPAGAVLVAKAGSSASQGQGVPWPGLQAAARQATQGLAAACFCTVVCAPFLSCHQLTISA